MDLWSQTTIRNIRSRQGTTFPCVTMLTRPGAGVLRQARLVRAGILAEIERAEAVSRAVRPTRIADLSHANDYVVSAKKLADRWPRSINGREHGIWVAPPRVAMVVAACHAGNDYQKSRVASRNVPRHGGTLHRRRMSATGRDRSSTMAQHCDAHPGEQVSHRHDIAAKALSWPAPRATVGGSYTILLRAVRDPASP